MERYIVRDIPRCDASLCAEFARLGTATVYEAQGQTGLLDDTMRPVLRDMSVCGPAVTVICPAGDNLMIHAAVECCRPGDILVVTTEGHANKHGMIGELLVKSLMKRGVRAVIMDGGVRDTRQIREPRLPCLDHVGRLRGHHQDQGGLGQCTRRVRGRARRAGRSHGCRRRRRGGGQARGCPRGARKVARPGKEGAVHHTKDRSGTARRRFLRLQGSAREARRQIL